MFTFYRLDSRRCVAGSVETVLSAECSVLCAVRCPVRCLVPGCHTHTHCVGLVPETAEAVSKGSGTLFFFFQRAFKGLILSHLRFTRISVFSDEMPLPKALFDAASALRAQSTEPKQSLCEMDWFEWGPNPSPSPYYESIVNI